MRFTTFRQMNAPPGLTYRGLVGIRFVRDVLELKTETPERLFEHLVVESAAIMFQHYIACIHHSILELQLSLLGYEGELKPTLSDRWLLDKAGRGIHAVVVCSLKVRLNSSLYHYEGQHLCLWYGVCDSLHQRPEGE